MNALAAGRTDDFGANLSLAVGVWMKQPLLPIISVLWWTLPLNVTGNDVVYFFLSILTIAFLGWPGTEREWYRRAFAGETFPPSQIWPTSRRFFWPFVRLGLLVSPLALLICVFWARGSTVDGIGVALVLLFILDVALTFVTPALTFTTSSARRALSIGLAMLRSHWPAAAPYALTPALAIILGTQTLLEPLIGPVGVSVATGLSGLVALAIKGATVAFYLRHLPASSA